MSRILLLLSQLGFFFAHAVNILNSNCTFTNYELCLIKESNDVYIVINATKFWIQNVDTFNYLKFIWADIISVDHNTISKFKTGPPIDFYNPSSYTPIAEYVSNKRKELLNLNELTKNGFHPLLFNLSVYKLTASLCKNR